MNQIDKLKARLATASPVEAQTLRELIATLEAAPSSQSEQPPAPAQSAEPLRYMNAEQARLWRPLAERRARAIVVEQPERKVE